MNCIFGLGRKTKKIIEAVILLILAVVLVMPQTANAFEEDKKMALDAGMNAHLAKPYDVPQITGTLAKLLKR